MRRDQLERIMLARDILYESVSANLRIVGSRAGSPAFIEDTTKTNHIGMYASTALLELYGLENTRDKEFFDLFLNRFSEEIWAPAENDVRKQRDSHNVFKLCAVLEALKAVSPEKRSKHFSKLYDFVVDRLVSLMLPQGYWEFSIYEETRARSEYALSTALVVLCLDGTKAGASVVGKAGKYLENWLIRALTSELKRDRSALPETALAAYALEKTRAVVPSSLTRRHKSHLALLLYRFFTSQPTFQEHLTRVFTAIGGEYRSSSYSFLVDGVILDYLILMESPYLKSRYLVRKLVMLAEHIIADRKYISGLDGHAFTRTNVKLLMLLQSIARSGHLLGESLVATVYFETLREPIYSKLRRRARSVAGGVFVLSASFLYLTVIAPNGGMRLQFAVALTTNLLSAIIYHWISE